MSTNCTKMIVLTYLAGVVLFSFNFVNADSLTETVLDPVQLPITNNGVWIRQQEIYVSYQSLSGSLDVNSKDAFQLEPIVQNPAFVCGLLGLNYWDTISTGLSIVVPNKEVPNLFRLMVTRQVRCGLEMNTTSIDKFNSQFRHFWNKYGSMAAGLNIFDVAAIPSVNKVLMLAEPLRLQGRFVGTDALSVLIQNTETFAQRCIRFGQSMPFHLIAKETSSLTGEKLFTLRSLCARNIGMIENVTNPVPFVQLRFSRNMQSIPGLIWAPDTQISALWNLLLSTHGEVFTL